MFPTSAKKKTLVSKTTAAHMLERMHEFDVHPIAEIVVVQKSFEHEGTAPRVHVMNNVYIHWCYECWCCTALALSARLVP
jgi:hypothetical protein